MKNEWIKKSKEEKQQKFKFRGKFQEVVRQPSGRMYPYVENEDTTKIDLVQPLLRNQKLYNEAYLENNKKTNWIPNNFEEKSLAVVQKIYDKLKTHDLFDFNVMNGPTDVARLKITCPLVGIVHYYEEDIVAKTRLLSTKWDKDIENNLLSELYSMFCGNIKNYMNQYKNFEFKFKLCNNNMNNLINLCFKIGNIFDNMKEVERGIRLNFKPNVKNRWAILNPKIAKNIFHYDPREFGGFEMLFSAGNIEYYVNENQPEDEIFLGQKVKGSNYTFNPYVMISHMEDKRLAMRYSACFNSEAQHNYKVIKLVK